MCAAMRALLFRQTLLLVAASLATVAALANCKLVDVADLPVTMNGLRPIVDAKINGADAHFILDSGAFFSTIPQATAHAFKLPLHRMPENMRVEGIGGRADTQVARVDEFIVAKARIEKVEFVVGGSDLDASAAGLLGQNILGSADVEYDLKNGMARLMHPDRDCEKTSLAYWSKNGEYSVIDLAFSRGRRQHTVATAAVNGKEVRVMFDTGATSILSLDAAKRAGIVPDGPGVVPAGYTHGLGRRTVQTWIAPVSSFQIGNESITNTHLRIGDIDFADVDMLIGIDFFLSHHLYVANSRDKLYFTYSGGPVFNLLKLSSTPPVVDADPHAESDAAAVEPIDAAGYARRGAAYAARRDFDRAVEDLNWAREKDPAEASYLYLRGMAQLGAGRVALALADLDAYLQQKPQDPAALLARARAHAQQRDYDAAQVDLRTIDSLVATDANIRLDLGSLLLRIGAYGSAIAQYDKWIETHDDDGNLSLAQGGRCRARTLLNQALEKAQEDCERALRASPADVVLRFDHGLLYLRQGRYADSLEELESVLTREPANAWARYARGLDKLHLGRTAEGQADMNAAAALQSTIAEDARKVGFVP